MRLTVKTRRVFLALSILFFSPAVSVPRAELAGYVCGGSATYAANEPDFYTNFVSVMEHLSALLADHSLVHYSIRSPAPPVYGFAQCHSDLSIDDCRLCFAEARLNLPRCLPAKKGRVYLEGCFVRYDSYNFFEEIVKVGEDMGECSLGSGLRMDHDAQLKFSDSVAKAVMIATREMLDEKHGGFGTAEVSTGWPAAYALGQCWGTMNSTACRICMEDAWEDLKDCLPGTEGRALNAGCYARYSSKKFYVEYEPEKYKNDISPSNWLLKGAAAGFALLVLVVLGCYIWCGKVSEAKEDSKKLNQLPGSVSKSHLHFNYEVLEQATDYFDPSNKLGQGGTSSVFKGTLPDGRMVAVKRLFFNTRQWVDNFFNEVNLINGIEHKNLVKLLGCSIEGPESLLVYEFIPNRTLGQVLFDRKKTRTVSFEQRFAIILGIAEGLAFLHEGSHGKIIHRDIKCSNVLLDEDLNPKIADFGLARCAGADRTHISTGIAGTLGYMAPEYILRGQLTEKADVYSFGVLAIETACGRKNNTYDDSDSVLQDEQAKIGNLRPHDIEIAIVGRAGPDVLETSFPT